MTFNPPGAIPYRAHRPERPALEIAHGLYELASQRRTVRQFASTPVPEELVGQLIRIAGTAPSGANKQPWRFVAVRDPLMKRRIRVAAEAEEREFYQRRASADWLKDLAPLGTDPEKPFLEDAPWLIAVFKLMQTDDGGQVYYVNESVGIAVGMFLAAAQACGLATLTHTPSPMKFLSEILGRPEHERPFLLIPLGYAAEGAVVPNIARKPLEQILVVR